jgi:hypothetical protein
MLSACNPRKHPLKEGNKSYCSNKRACCNLLIDLVDDTSFSKRTRRNPCLLAISCRIPVYDSFYAPARPFMLTLAVPEALQEGRGVGNTTDASNSTLSASNSDVPGLVQGPSFLIRSPVRACLFVCGFGCGCGHKCRC